MSTYESSKMEEREFLRPQEVARMLGISREQVLRHLRGRTLPGLKLGRVWLVRTAELKRYLLMKEQLAAEEQ